MRVLDFELFLEVHTNIRIVTLANYSNCSCPKYDNNLYLQLHTTSITLYDCLSAVQLNMFGSSTTWDRSTMHPKFDPIGVRTHDLQIMTVHFMSVRLLL